MGNVSKKPILFARLRVGDADRVGLTKLILRLGSTAYQGEAAVSQEEILAIFERIGIQAHCIGTSWVVTTPGKYGWQKHYETFNEVLGWIFSYFAQELPEHLALKRFSDILVNADPDLRRELHQWKNEGVIKERVRSIISEIEELAASRNYEVSDTHLSLYLEEILADTLGVDLPSLYERMHDVLKKVLPISLDTPKG